jgi:hypothetical protein
VPPGVPLDAGAGALPGASDGGGAAPLTPVPSPLGGPISKDCQGLPLEGLMESPGGNALPNKCQPFHATLNNPYAVRCVDAWSWYKTKYPGDEYCILPPPKDKGIQIGLHPQGSAYWDQISKKDLSGYDAPGADWLVKVGGEETKTYHAPVALAESKKYYRTYFRMRTGSHHNIITMHNSSEPAGWDQTSGEALPAFFDPTAGSLTGVLGGQERPDDSTPVTLQRPPEDEGLYLSFPANPNVHYNIHHFNTTEGEILKEGWVNLWWEEEGSTRINWFMGLNFGQVPGLAIEPGRTAELHYYFAPTSTVRLVRFFGHRHVWTPNFSGWITRADGSTEMIYQSFHWLDMPTYRYDSVVQNPKPDFPTRTDGGASGIITLGAGDQLHFNCHIEYTDARAAAENAPKPASNGTLRFANQALTAEMCIAYGNVVGSLGGVNAAGANSKIPAEAK